MKKYECTECHCGPCEISSELMRIHGSLKENCFFIGSRQKANWKEVEEEQFEIETGGYPDGCIGTEPMTFAEAPKIGEKVLVDMPEGQTDCQWHKDLITPLNGKTVTICELDTDDQHVMVYPDDMKYPIYRVDIDWLVSIEPKVLSAEESYHVKYSHMKNSDDEFAWSDGYVVGYEDGDKNGRLERDLELRPLVDYCKKQASENRHAYWQDMMGLIENIPPLNKD